MKIEQGKHVAIQYKLTGYEAPETQTDDIELEDIEETKPDHPFEFIYGVGQLLPAFEKQIDGMQEGDTFDFTLSPADAYGEYDDEKVVALPKKFFCDDKGNFLSKFVVEGGEVPLQNQNGDIIQATVQKITNTEVVCDVNHPLAGMTLHFVGSIQEVREASEQDKLEYMRQMTGQFETNCGHGGGCHGGGCHGGGCGGNCGGDCGGNCDGNCGGDCHCK